LGEKEPFVAGKTAIGRRFSTLKPTLRAIDGNELS
jgi:hypothetical protein